MQQLGVRIIKKDIELVVQCCATELIDGVRNLHKKRIKILNLMMFEKKHRSDLLKH